MKRVAELALNAKEVSEVHQRFMVIEISVQKVDKLINVIGSLDSFELLLKANILRGLHKGENLLSSLLIYPYLFHR